VLLAYFTALRFTTKFVPDPAKAGISIDEAIGAVFSILYWTLKLDAVSGVPDTVTMFAIGIEIDASP
jgi:hypothetical protein